MDQSVLDINGRDALLAELDRGSDISIISFVNTLILHAHTLRASDIHIDPALRDVRIRLRIDGVLQDTCLAPKTIHSEIISRIKVLAGLRTDEHQATQDGRFRFAFPNSDEHIDMRVSIVPTYHGENVVMRLLAGNSENYSLGDLGFSDGDQKKIEAAIKRPNGMVLSTGPTGSGKTTTLYTLLRMLNSKEISIITIEDPIEYAVGDVEQIQVNPRASLTFANGLRSILRQDPDIIMVGEIRDAETANIAVNTALTGHLLLSTLLVASTINIAIGQRLVRKICKACREEVHASGALVESLSSVPLRKAVKKDELFYKGKGCDECNGSGYRGRLCVNEVLVADGDIKEAIMRKASSAELRTIAIKNGMVTMLEDGFRKARAGETTIEEILRVVHE
jgi:type II secretory ATPase GspE/PulE/Tfp pilus assembly ATPase PilB-like protein